MATYHFHFICTLVLVFEAGFSAVHGSQSPDPAGGKHVPFSLLSRTSYQVTIPTTDEIPTASIPSFSPIHTFHSYLPRLPFPHRLMMRGASSSTFSPLFKTLATCNFIRSFVRFSARLERKVAEESLEGLEGREWKGRDLRRGNQSLFHSLIIRSFTHLFTHLFTYSFIHSQVWPCCAVLMNAIV